MPEQNVDTRKANVGVSEVKVDTVNDQQAGSRIPVEVSIETSPAVDDQGNIDNSNLQGATVTVMVKRTNGDVDVRFVEGNQPNPAHPDNSEQATTTIVISKKIENPGDPIVIPVTAILPKNVPEGRTNVTLKAEIISVTRPKDTGAGMDVLTNSVTPNTAQVTTNPAFKDATIKVVPKVSPPQPNQQPRRN